MKTRVAVVLLVLVAVAPVFVTTTCQAVLQAALDLLQQLLGGPSA